MKKPLFIAWNVLIGVLTLLSLIFYMLISATAEELQKTGAIDSTQYNVLFFGLTIYHMLFVYLSMTYIGKAYHEGEK